MLQKKQQTKQSLPVSDLQVSQGGAGAVVAPGHPGRELCPGWGYSGAVLLHLHSEVSVYPPIPVLHAHNQVAAPAHTVAALLNQYQTGNDLENSLCQQFVFKVADIQCDQMR